VDPCTTDPWYDKYVVMWEPPIRPDATPTLSRNFRGAPGVFQGSITEPLARQLVWNSLTAAGVNADPDIWNAIHGGGGRTTFEVNGVSPAGDRWDYFLVPIVSAAKQVTAFVQLDADGGASRASMCSRRRCRSTRSAGLARSCSPAVPSTRARV